MKKARLLALVLILALLFVGCAKAPSGNLVGDDMGAPEEGNGIYGEGEKVETSVGIEENRKLIRTVNMEAETSDLDAILADLDAQLAQLGGYVQEKSVQNGRNGSYRYATLTLRIPPAGAAGSGKGPKRPAVAGKSACHCAAGAGNGEIPAEAL
jgi:hypothetical protein